MNMGCDTYPVKVGRYEVAIRTRSRYAMLCSIATSYAMDSVRTSQYEQITFYLIICPRSLGDVEWNTAFLRGVN